MAKWKYNGKPIKKVLDFDLVGLKVRVKLEPGDMIQHLSGEILVQPLDNKWSSSLVGKTNHRFTVLSAEYIRRRYGTTTDIRVMSLGEDSNLNSQILRFVNDVYRDGCVRIFPVDALDKW